MKEGKRKRTTYFRKKKTPNRTQLGVQKKLGRGKRPVGQRRGALKSNGDKGKGDWGKKTKNQKKACLSRPSRKSGGTTRMKQVNENPKFEGPGPKKKKRGGGVKELEVDGNPLGGGEKTTTAKMNYRVGLWTGGKAKTTGGKTTKTQGTLAHKTHELKGENGKNRHKNRSGKREKR